MSKCNKAKNPCKICLGPVTKHNGLKCQGRCQTWVHFSCLNYTPGKIKDIKAGIIKVACPCPDCKTTFPKEFRTDMPISCNNDQCPAHQMPKCANTTCPLNAKKGKPSCPPVTCQIPKCGVSCKQYSNIPRSQVAPPCKPIPACQQPPPCPRPCPPPPGPPDSSQHSDSCFNPNICYSGCSSASAAEIRPDYGDSRALEQTAASFHAMEQMCNTVGLLTNQINDLMCEMKKAVNNRNGGAPSEKNSSSSSSMCTQPGPKRLCPKPCYCPGNPRKN